MKQTNENYLKGLIEGALVMWGVYFTEIDPQVIDSLNWKFKTSETGKSTLVTCEYLIATETVVTRTQTHEDPEETEDIDTWGSYGFTILHVENEAKFIKYLEGIFCILSDIKIEN